MGRGLYEVWGNMLVVCKWRGKRGGSIVPARKSPNASAASLTSGSSIDKTLPPLLPLLSLISTSIPDGDSTPPLVVLFFGDSCEGPGL